MMYADQRWIGDHGIGRFARQVLAGLRYGPVPLASNPASPLDPWRLTRALSKLTRNDLFFSPGYNSPLACPAPFVLTLHDLNHLDRPENSGSLKRLYYTTILKRACHRSAAILTVSEFSRTRIIEWSGVRPEKVFNVKCGVSSEYSPKVKAYELPYSYLLCVSNRKPHKNELRVLEAFAKARLGTEIRLVFTGDSTAQLAALIARHCLNNRVHFVGGVSEDKLPSLYRGAEALVFPSLYEGFGLPVLEAMACGTPVLTSNSSALPEVAGEAALLVDPTSIEQIADGITRIATDASLREQLRMKGLAQSANFPWERTVAGVQEVLTGSFVGLAGKEW